MLMVVAWFVWDYMLHPVLRVVWFLIGHRARRYLTARFYGVTRAEAWGFGIWGLMGVVVAVPELWAAASGSGFAFPTISSTTGHLEDIAPIVGIAPVAVLVMAGYAVLRYPSTSEVAPLPQEPPSPGQARTFRAVQRSDYGRLVRGELDLTTGDVVATGRQEWPVGWYFLLVSAVIAIAGFAASRSNNKWHTGYVLYGLIAVLWILLPAAASYWAKRDVPFLTLFFTLRSLERRLHLVAYAVAAGLGILLIHLALYPWPDLARTSSQYAGLTPGHAQEQAEAAVAQLRNGKSSLFFGTKYRGIAHEHEAWFVYFRTPNGGASGCVVVLTKQNLAASTGCRTRP